MKNLISVLLLFLTLTSCKFSGKETYLLTTDSSPKVHYSSTGHNVGAPSSFVFQNGIYSVFYHDFSLDKDRIKSIYRTNSNDMIHWNPAEKVVFTEKNQSIQYVNVIVGIQNGTKLKSSSQSPLVALLLIDKDRNPETPNAYFKLNFSLDNGKTWSIVNEKVVFPDEVKNDFKPALIWDESTKNWIMSVIYNQSVRFYSSPNLKNWKLESTFEKESQYRDNIWLKATVFPMNNGANWILFVDQEFANPRDGSTVQYFIGTFDGHKFTADASVKPHWLDYGKDNIYNVVCSGLASTNQPIVIGLKNNVDYALIGSMKPFWGSFTFPRTLSLAGYSGESILASQPIPEIWKLQNKTQTLNNLSVSNDLDISYKIALPMTPSLITLKFETSEMTRMTFPARFGIQFENDKAEKLIVGYDVFKGSYFVDRTNFSIIKDNSQFKGIDVIPSYHSGSELVMTMIVDDSSLELFVENGKQALTENYFTDHKFNKASLFAENGVIKAKVLSVCSLKSIW
jgi:fructan beta-fructosidase